jgi:PDZ domain
MGARRESPVSSKNRPLRALAAAVLAAAWLAGCASYQSLHYSLAYTPLVEVESGAFQEPPPEMEYRVLDSIDAMAATEADMQRQGYVMIGYSHMLSPQLRDFADPGARELGRKHGASVVLSTYRESHYLATLWARPKSFILGAFYSDALPSDAKASLDKVMGIQSAVIVQTVVDESPAFGALFRPGDLLIALDDQPIRSAAELDKLLTARAGTAVTFVLWSMEDGPPRKVRVKLNPRGG